MLQWLGIAQIFKTSRGNSKHSKLIAKLYILASLIILINFDKKGMDPRPLERHGKSLVACQITPCLQNMGTANTFTWNSRLREARKFGAFGKLSLVCKTWERWVPLHGIHAWERGSKIWFVWQDVHCLHTLGTSGNLVHVGKGMYLYMTM